MPTVLELRRLLRKIRYDLRETIHDKDFKYLHIKRKPELEDLLARFQGQPPPPPPAPSVQPPVAPPPAPPPVVEAPAQPQPEPDYEPDYEPEAETDNTAVNSAAIKIQNALRNKRAADEYQARYAEKLAEKKKINAIIIQNAFRNKKAINEFSTRFTQKRAEKIDKYASVLQNAFRNRLARKQAQLLIDERDKEQAKRDFSLRLNFITEEEQKIKEQNAKQILELALKNKKAREELKILKDKKSRLSLPPIAPQPPRQPRPSFTRPKTAKTVEVSPDVVEEILPESPELPVIKSREPRATYKRPSVAKSVEITPDVVEEILPEYIPKPKVKKVIKKYPAVPEVKKRKPKTIVVEEVIPVMQMDVPLTFEEVFRIEATSTLQNAFRNKLARKKFAQLSLNRREQMDNDVEEITWAESRRISPLDRIRTSRAWNDKSIPLEQKVKAAAVLQNVYRERLRAKEEERRKIVADLPPLTNWAQRVSPLDRIRINTLNLRPSSARTQRSTPVNIPLRPASAGRLERVNVRPRPDSASRTFNKNKPL